MHQSIYAANARTKWALWIVATGVVIFFASGFFGVAKKGQGRWSIQANVIHIENKKWTLVEPSVPALPGVFAPYPTSDIHRKYESAQLYSAGRRKGWGGGHPVWIFWERAEEHRKRLYFCRSWKKGDSTLLWKAERHFSWKLPWRVSGPIQLGQEAQWILSMAVICSSTGWGFRSTATSGCTSKNTSKSWAKVKVRSNGFLHVYLWWPVYPKIRIPNAWKWFLVLKSMYNFALNMCRLCDAEYEDVSP